MQKLSLQLACRYFADSNIFIAGSWCFGALVISLYLLTWGGKDKCALQYLLHLHTYKCLLLGGCFGFLIGFEVMVWFPFGCSVSDAISFSILSCPVASSSFGSMCQSRFRSRVPLARLGAGDAQPWWARGLCLGLALLEPRGFSWLPTEELRVFCRNCKKEIHGCDRNLPNLYREYGNLFKTLQSSTLTL